ncbi:hypothetical protein HDU83_008481 [Entophlyctis luteolus]|nr:hypothetical protein HDU83_008481 [Entophlyctis luteolus]
MQVDEIAAPPLLLLPSREGPSRRVCASPGAGAGAGGVRDSDSDGDGDDDDDARAAIDSRAASALSREPACASPAPSSASAASLSFDLSQAHARIWSDHRRQHQHPHPYGVPRPSRRHIQQPHQTQLRLLPPATVSRTRSDSTRGVVRPAAQATAPDIVRRPNRRASFNSSTTTSTFVDYVTDLFNALPTISQKSSDASLKVDVSRPPPPISIVTTIDNQRDTLSLTQFKPYTPNAAASPLTPNIPMIEEQIANQKSTTKPSKPRKHVSYPVMHSGSIRRRSRAVFHHHSSSRLNRYSCVDDTDASRAGTPLDRDQKFEAENQSSSSSGVCGESSRFEGQYVEFEHPGRSKSNGGGNESGTNDCGSGTGGSDSLMPGSGWKHYPDEVSSSEADGADYVDDHDSSTYNRKTRTKASDSVTFDSTSSSARDSPGSSEFTETASDYTGKVVARKPSKLEEFFTANPPNLSKKKSFANPDQARGDGGRTVSNETVRPSNSSQFASRFRPPPPKEPSTPIWKDVPIMYFKNGVHWTVSRSDQVVSPMFPDSTGLTAYGLWFEHTSYTLVFKILRPQIYPFDNEAPFEITVDRRYTEFRELFLELTKMYRDKIFSRFDPAIVTSRMNAFSALLNFIALHPTLFNSPPVLKFLGIDLHGEDSGVSRGRRASAALVEPASSSARGRNDGSPGRRSFSNPLH